MADPRLYCSGVPQDRRRETNLRVNMPRRPAQFTQADVARVIRAAKQAGATEVEVKLGEQAVVMVRLSTDAERNPVAVEAIVL